MNTIVRFEWTDPEIFQLFDLWKTPPERDSTLVQKYRQLYENLGLIQCLYCGSTLSGTKYHLDHLIPWIRIPINQFWNLYPACAACNTKKRDKIPLLSKQTINKIEQHLKASIDNQETEYGSLITKDLERLYSEAFKSKIITKDQSLLVQEILEYILAIRNELASRIPGEFFEMKGESSEDDQAILLPKYIKGEKNDQSL